MDIQLYGSYNLGQAGWVGCEIALIEIKREVDGRESEVAMHKYKPILSPKV